MRRKRVRKPGTDETSEVRLVTSDQKLHLLIRAEKEIEAEFDVALCGEQVENLDCFTAGRLELGDVCPACLEYAAPIARKYAR